VKTGLLKPDAATLKLSGVPTITVLPGVRPWIVEPIPDVDTVSVSTVVAVLPEVSLTVIVSGCVPISLELGLQEKVPEELIVVLLMLEPEAESLIENVGLVNPVGATEKETV
jgi:hypothetical protein